MNCTDWYEAEAFCIWDGGRLPTEAEWNYAAAGGTQQRVYPWGNAVPNASYAVYGPLSQLAAVGSTSPTGDGYFGQADLAGNAYEWQQDGFAIPYAIALCNNCADLRDVPQRALRGGSVGYDASLLPCSFRIGDVPSDRGIVGGARCARPK